MSTVLDLLSPTDRDRVDQYIEQLGDGSLRASDLNRALQYENHDVQQVVSHFFRNMNYAEDGGRSMPFAEPLKMADVERAYGLEEDSSRQVYQQVYDNVLTVGLQERMGTDTDLPLPGEASLHEVIEAAVDLHSGEEDK